MILFVIRKCQRTTLSMVIIISVLFCRQVNGETAEKGSWARLQHMVKE